MGKKKPTPKKVWQPLVKDPDWFREQRLTGPTTINNRQRPQQPSDPNNRQTSTSIKNLSNPL